MPSEFVKRKRTLTFYKIDSSKDGFLSMEDWVQRGKTVAEVYNFQPGTDEYDKLISAYVAVWNTDFKTVDLDGDNKISIEEYLKSWEVSDDPSQASEFKAGRYRSFNTVFDVLDVDGNGTIDMKEFGANLKALGVSEDQVELSFSKLDLDRNGVITRDEFATSLWEYYTSEDPQSGGNWSYGTF